MEDRYEWAERRCGIQHTVSFGIWDLMEPYITEIKPGFCQIRYGKSFFNFDVILAVHLMTFIYRMDTGYPQLDQIVKEILEDRRAERDPTKSFFRRMDKL